MIKITEAEKQRQARNRRRKYLKNPVNQALDKQRSSQRYAEIKKRKAQLEFILGRTITLSEFHMLEANAAKESV